MMHRFREPTSGLTHLLGAVLGVVGLIWLVSKTHDQPDKMLSVAIYGVSLILLYSASSALHLVNGSERTIFRLRRCDHAAIYILIAGTYTPLCYHFLDGGWRWLLLGTIWTLAIMGAIYKLRFHWQRRTSTLGYVAMGWVGIIAAPTAVHLLPTGAIMLILGGALLYTVGVVVFALDKPNFHRYFNAHDLWHVFVMGGSALHFAAIMLYVV
jgi:hemolysin III